MGRLLESIDAWATGGTLVPTTSDRAARHTSRALRRRLRSRGLAVAADGSVEALDPAASAARQRRRTLRHRFFPAHLALAWRHRAAYLFLAPFFALFLLFMLLPIVFSLGLSLHRWNGIMAPQYVGLTHYGHALRDPAFWRALGVTFVFTLVTVAASALLGLALALHLNTFRILKRLYRGIFFVPSVISVVVVALIWKLILNGEVGLVGHLLHGTARAWGHLTRSPAPWEGAPTRFLDHPNSWVPLLTMTLVNVWAAVGFNTVIFLAGLQGIPSHLYEAATIDGASRRRCFRHITLPLLKPTIFFVVLVSTIESLQVFVLPSVMNRDAESTTTVVYYLFRNAFEYHKMGYASAIAYFLFALTVALSLLIRWTLGRHLEDFVE